MSNEKTPENIIQKKRPTYKMVFFKIYVISLLNYKSSIFIAK